MIRHIFIISSLLIVLFSLISCGDRSTKTPPPDNTNQVQESSNRYTEKPEKSVPPSAPDFAALVKAHADNPLDYTSAYSLAHAYWNSGDKMKAMAIFGRYINDENSQYSAQAKLDRTMLLVDDGKLDDAYKEFKALTADSSMEIRGEAYFQLGNLITVNNYSPPDGDKVDLAISYYETALDLEPSSGLLYRRLADLLHSEGQIDKAREYLAIFLSVYPKDGQSWLDIGDWSVEVKDTERAREYYKMALESEEESVRKKAKDALDQLKK